MAGLAFGVELGLACGSTARMVWIALLLLAPAASLAHRRVGAAWLVFVLLALCGHERATWQPVVEGWPAVGRREPRAVRGLVHAVRSRPWSHGASGGTLEIEISSVDVEHEDVRPGDGVRLSVGRIAKSWEIGDEIALRIEPRGVRGFCNSGRDRWARWLGRRGVLWTAWLRDDEGIELVDSGSPGTPGARLVQARGAVAAAIDRSVAGSAAAVLRALVVGDKGRLSAEMREAFARTGTSHLLAVSGMHLAIVAGGTYAVVSFALLGVGGGLGGRPVSQVAAPASLVVAAGYAGLTGGAVATVRALVMAGFLLVGVTLQRRAAPVGALWAALGVLVVLDPEVLRDLSFQLSFVSVGSILAMLSRVRRTRLARVLHPGVDAGWRARARAWVLGGILVGLSAGLATASLGAHYFGLVSIVGVFANLVVGPLLGVVALGLGLFGALLCGLVPALGRTAFAAAGAVIEVATTFVDTVARWPWAAVAVPLPHRRLVVAWIVAVGGVLLPRRAWRNFARVAAAALALTAWGPSARARGLRVSFLDVGQGDAAVVEGPDGAAWVVDGGGLAGDFDTGAGVVLPALAARSIRSLAAVVLSHADRDHYGGLASVVEETRPRELWWNGRPAESRRFRDLTEAVDAQGVEPRRLSARARAKDGRSLRWEALHPPSSSILSGNDASLVVAVRYGASRVLFSGDVERRGERALVASGQELLATVLKVPHHGSRTSSGLRFVGTVRPAVAVASLGTFNRFGFPAPEVERRYRSRGARFKTTGESGEIVVTSDGQLERVETCRPGAPP